MNYLSPTGDTIIYAKKTHLTVIQYWPDIKSAPHFYCSRNFVDALKINVVDKVIVITKRHYR